MAEHTPGPWYFGPSFDARLAPNGEFIIQGSNELGGGPILPILGRTHNFPKNAEANARLIAAAPELLDALKMLVADVGEYEAWQRPCHALDVAIAAIAKAQGFE